MKFLKLFLTLLLVSLLSAHHTFISMDKSADSPTSIEEHVKKLQTSVQDYKGVIKSIQDGLAKEKDAAKKATATKNLESFKQAVTGLEATIASLKDKAQKEKASLEEAKTQKTKLEAATKFVEERKNGITQKPKMKNFFEKKADDNKGPSPSDIISKGVDIAKTCTSAFFENVPPTFCWKKGADFGIIPTGCPSGFFRHLALCFENCRPGFKFDGGALCIKDCPPNTTHYPLTCTHWSPWIWETWTVSREAYFPKSITNFEAPCPQGYYKGGALCYRDCAKIGLTNCGIGMCAASGLNCAAGIAGMVTDFLVSLAKGITFILSFGTSSAAAPEMTAAKTSLRTLATKATDAVKAGVTLIKNIATNPVARKALLDKVKDFAIKKIKAKIIDKAVELAVSKVCEEVGNKLLDKSKVSQEGANSTSESIVSKAISAIDVLGVSGIVKECSDIKDGGLMCAKSVLTTVDKIDPTGLSGMATAFMQPICDI